MDLLINNYSPPRLYFLFINYKYTPNDPDLKVLNARSLLVDNNLQIPTQKTKSLLLYSVRVYCRGI